LEIDMKLVKSLLLGSAAGLCAVAGAQAADLPVRKAAPVDYVRVCTVGAGFFFIPARKPASGSAVAPASSTSTPAALSRDVSGLPGDRAASTSIAALDRLRRAPHLRALRHHEPVGAYLTSGTAQRYAFAFPGLGQDTFGRTQKHVDIDKAFIQFAGITAGPRLVLFDFYATDLEFINANIVSNVSATNLLAYTATFGGGFSATVSAEDPIFRRNPVFATVSPTGSASARAPRRVHAHRRRGHRARVPRPSRRSSSRTASRTTSR
jgi:hypothetical protein